MARPIRCRRVCAEPECRGFAPQIVTGIGTVILTVDEYEVIRLVDYEKRTHEQCAAQMEISRTTVTEIMRALGLSCLTAWLMESLCRLPEDITGSVGVTGSEAVDAAASGFCKQSEEKT